MEDKARMEQQENPVPKWIKLMWGAFILWAIIYMASYWLPDLYRWIQTADPDATQWQDYKKS